MLVQLGKHKYTNTQIQIEIKNTKYKTEKSSLVVDEEIASLAFVKMCKWSDRNLFIKQSSPTPDSVLRSLRILKIHHLLYFKITVVAKFIMGLQNLTSLTLRSARTPKFIMGLQIFKT